MAKQKGLIMGNYIKDKNLIICYMGSEKEVPIQLLPGLFRDKTSGKSLIISARTGPMSRDMYSMGDVTVDMPDGTIKKFEEKQLMEYIYRLTESERINFQIQSDKNLKALKHIQRLWTDATSDKIMVLSYWDGFTVDELTDQMAYLGLDFLSIKIGGPELISEFLLADFCNHGIRKIVAKPGNELSDNNTLDPYQSAESLFEEQENFDYVLDWNFSIQGNIDFPKYFEEEGGSDDGGGLVKCSKCLYYYSIDMKALDKLIKLLHIPARVIEMLTQDQLLELKRQAPKILFDEIDYIAIKVFSQNLDNFKEDRKYSELVKGEAGWSSSMHGALGGIGGQSVYLGGGLSITASGKLDEQ